VGIAVAVVGVAVAGDGPVYAAGRGGRPGAAVFACAASAGVLACALKFPALDVGAG
jgi:hypothetical protein